MPWALRDAPVQEWLGGDAVEALASACQERIEAIYDRIAATTDAGDAPLFAEKCNLRAAGLLTELYPASRELFLVRDFRDMVSSILAFNRKRGAQGFGRAGAGQRRRIRRIARADGRPGSSGHGSDGAARAHLVRYEDLVLDPEPTLGGLLGYLGVDASRDTVAACSRRCAEEMPELRDHATSEARAPRSGGGA